LHCFVLHRMINKKITVPLSAHTLSIMISHSLIHFFLMSSIN
jgi:hypothetical protein